jgi:hypothetical protein
MIVSWKLESRKSLRENKLQFISNTKLDRWIIFLMLHISMEIINDLELSHGFIALNYFLIPRDDSDEAQKDILDDNLRLTLSLSSCILMNLGLPLLGL